MEKKMARDATFPVSLSVGCCVYKCTNIFPERKKSHVMFIMVPVPDPRGQVMFVCVLELVRTVPDLASFPHMASPRDRFLSSDSSRAML